MKPAYIAKRIRVLRGQAVLLDVDLADLYGVSSEQLRELVRRNQSTFSVEFAFSIEPNEMRDAPLAFTEHGVILAAHVLNNRHAVQMSIEVVRAFVKRREDTPSNSELDCRIGALERSIAMLDAKTREQFEAIYRAIDIRLAPPASEKRSDSKLH